MKELIELAIVCIWPVSIMVCFWMVIYRVKDLDKITINKYYDHSMNKGGGQESDAWLKSK